MPDDYIDPNDDGFRDFAENLKNVIVASPAAYGLVAGDGASLNSAFTSFDSALSDAKTKATAAQTATTTKDTAREVLERMVRGFAQRIQKNASVTPAAKTAAGLPAYDTTKTPTQTPTTAPQLQVDTRNRLEHRISWKDSATPNSRAKPKGAWGLNLYRKKGGPAPVGKTGCELLGMMRTSPTLEEYESADGNTTVWYVGAWVDMNGQEGPFSEAVSATVTC